ncbi:hypothetical protein [Microbacterium sp.]|uniref:hypothetical protein n=1 Tax=Microbacterium sp. TaxID=51671 RepID=UPI001AC94CB1|nr:hypothetical protein [Microbacterium sp.]MBN9156903.1 hypothetical protein [Microbacterium sp.]
MFWTVLGTLAGAAIGMVGAIFVQRQSSRADDLRFERSRLDRRREELRLEINSFFAATQRAERVAGQDVPRASKEDAAEEMWASHKRLTVLVDEGLKGAADSYCNQLGECLWSPTDEPTWQRIGESSREFRRLASEALAAD